MGRCLDFGPPPQTAGSPVFVYDCNGTVAQQIGIEEFQPVVTRTSAPSVNGIVMPHDHQVRLHAGTLCIGVDSEQPAEDMALFLGQCSLTPAQIFVLDGDSIILDYNRDLVVQLQDSRTPNRTPLILGHRWLSDVEFWDFFATDGSGRKPTSVFVPVSQASELQQALHDAAPNTVIQIMQDISFTALPTALPIKSGVTIRGDRRRTLLGPQLSLSVDSGVVPQASPQSNSLTAFLEALGTNVRVTGLRIRGPSRNDCNDNPDASCSQHGVAGFITSVANENVKIVIDHNDMSDWTRAAIDLYSYLGEPRTCPQPVTQLWNVVIARNFIHDNRQSHNNPKSCPNNEKTCSDADGYGIAAGWGASPLIPGNTFLENVHSITADGSAYSSYAAWDNLLLSTLLGANIDMHGSGPDHDGGVGGAGAEVLRNTFRDTQYPNFSVRGYPCNGGLDVFRGNVALQPVASAIEWQGGGAVPPSYMRIDSRFSVPDLLSNNAQMLSVGDFDGDHKDDLFLATGAAWYYAPAANAEWRFLSAKSDPVNSLLFGDFDGDGRTDVFTQVGDDWMVSWGGRSRWQVLSNRDNDWTAPGTGNGSHSMLDFAIGDFVGDNRADVFYADGTNWYVSDGGVGPFVLYATSSFKVPELAFGHFDKSHTTNPKTDVVGVVDNQWMAVFAQEDHAWKPLRPKLTNTMAGLIVADFNGDGIDDIAQFNGNQSRVSIDGRNGWTPIGNGFPVVAIGRFDGIKGADILQWAGNSLWIISRGNGAPQQQSRQDMR